LKTRTLIVGDPHATPQELGDCAALKELVYSSAKEYKVDTTIILGDIYNSHSVVNTPCIHFWKEFLDGLGKCIVLVGNHDCFSPTIQMPHALISHKGNPNCIIVDVPMQIMPGVAAMPYYHDPVEFLAKATALRAETGATTLICHQTFDGAKLQEGFYAKDGVNPVAVPFDSIISGHIHTPMKFSKVFYAGSPRWRTLSDANQERYIYVVDFEDTGVYKGIKAIPTTGICKRIYRYVDSEDNQAKIEAPVDKADVRVDIYGSQEYISRRMLELKASHNAKCRSFPLREKRSQISESDGISVSFNKFLGSFIPPNGTEIALLNKIVGERLNGFV
jgi:DNA repair exonuclease SbcCD nuclease subunit